MTTRVIGLAAPAGLAAVLAALTFAAWSQASQQSATSGAVTATLSWSGDAQDTMSAALSITRNGVSGFNDAIPKVVCDGCRLAGNGADDVKAMDLDADGEPEVIVTADTGGSACCLMLGIWDWVPDLSIYRESAVDLGTIGFNLDDIDHDGVPEFDSFDARFNRYFTDVADELPPPQVIHYLHQDGVPVFADVTTKFPRLIRSNAVQAKKRFASLHRRDPNARGWLATYVADELLLGRASTGTRELDKQIKRGIVASSFRASLLKQLHKWQYR